MSEKSELTSALRACQSEAKNYFNDDRVFIEKFVQNPKHIEIQVFGDTHGNAVHLGERDCSIQRRYQKVIEEGTATILTPAIRARLYDAALRLVKHLNYRNAGTVEFLYDADRQQFFFIEMNARVQVEHPVSELITGVDIVQEQLRIAAGQPLSVKQEAIKVTGHAIECRINAESPENNFMPRPGRINHWQAPRGEGIRLDSHCYSGYLVPPYYDSMIAKLLVLGADRPAAIRRMGDALDQFRVEGIATNIEFHKAVLADEEYVTGRVNTKWLENGFLPRFQKRVH